MDEKRADNNIVNVKPKEEISRIDTQIDFEKNRMKNLDDMEEMFISLNKNISKCVELLNKSIKGNNVTRKLNAIEENNKINFNKSISSIDMEREDIKNRLYNLNEEKENYQQQIREENNKKLMEEREGKRTEEDNDSSANQGDKSDFS